MNQNNKEDSPLIYDDVTKARNSKNSQNQSRNNLYFLFFAFFGRVFTVSSIDMASSSQSIIIEDSPVKQTPACKEALTIDAAKVDLLSSYTQLMFYLFKASIDFGDKDKNKQEKKHPVQLQTVSEYSMTKAKVII